MTTSKILLSISEDQNRVLIGFWSSGNPLKFYVYGTDGKFELTMQYKAPENVGFAYHLKKLPVGSPEKGKIYPFVQSIFIHKNFYFVFLEYKGLSSNNIYGVIESKALVFNNKGKFLTEFKVPLGMKFFSINNNGLIAGTNVKEDEPKVYIYKLHTGSN